MMACDYHLRTSVRVCVCVMMEIPVAKGPAGGPVGHVFSCVQKTDFTEFFFFFWLGRCPPAEQATDDEGIGIAVGIVVTFVFSFNVLYTHTYTR